MVAYSFLEESSDKYQMQDWLMNGSDTIVMK